MCQKRWSWIWQCLVTKYIWNSGNICNLIFRNRCAPLHHKIRVEVFGNEELKRRQVFWWGERPPIKAKIYKQLKGQLGPPVRNEKCLFVTFLPVPPLPPSLVVSLDPLSVAENVCLWHFCLFTPSPSSPVQSGSSTELSVRGARRDVENTPKLYPGPTIQSRPSIVKTYTLRVIFLKSLEVKQIITTSWLNGNCLRG